MEILVILYKFIIDKALTREYNKERESGGFCAFLQPRTVRRTEAAACG